MSLLNSIRQIPDYPKKGILFYDISPLLADGKAWQETMRQIEKAVKPHKPDLIAGIESRGFLVAAPLAQMMGVGFIMLRKKGKLPGPTIRYSYDLEYGQDVIEAQEDAVREGQRIIIVDDLLATGGTMAAGIALLRQMKADVRGAACIIELGFLHGRQKIDIPLTALITVNQ
ncbi:MAG: adenine phosphoribosyltransferase [Dongiaceae bacterium]